VELQVNVLTNLLSYSLVRDHAVNYAVPVLPNGKLMAYEFLDFGWNFLDGFVSKNRVFHSLIG